MRKARPVTRLDIKAPLSVGVATIDTTDNSAPPAYPTIPPPDTIILSTSIVYSTGSPLARITASWNAPAAADPVTTGYYIQVSESALFPDGQTPTYPASTNSATIDGLKASTATVTHTYYVRVATRINSVLSDWSGSAHIDTAQDLDAPTAPSSLSTTWNSNGSLISTWTPSTSANRRDTEVSIYADATKAVLYRRTYQAHPLFEYTAAMNGADTSGAYDPALLVEIRERSWNTIFSTAISASATLARPATPSGLASSWDSDLGTAGPDCAISWTAVAGLRYTLTIDGIARALGQTDHYTYSLDTNRSDHSGTPDPALSLSLIAVDALGQTSAVPATLTATNAAPAAPSVTLTDGFGFIQGRVTSSGPADFALYEYVWKLAGVAQLTQESAGSEQTYEAPTNGTWTLAVRVKDTFGQYSPTTTSVSVVHDTLTITSLRAGATYTDDMGNSALTLAVLKDGNTTSGGISYS